jgi:abortive infection bacteriophage resistance protein
LLKLPKTIDEQITLLEDRGIIIEDHDFAKLFLTNNNYYRLMGYSYQFKIDEDSYINNTKFSTVAKTYSFDCLLRQIILPILELLEVSFRAKIAYFMCHRHGSEFYLNIDIFQNPKFYFDFIGIINRCIRQSKNELFVRHHLEKYNGRFPFWVLIEILSFSSASKFFKNINTADKKEFSRTYYQFDAEIFENWMQHFSVIRNTCAHYGRIYNKNLLPKIKLLREDNIERTMKIFDSLFILKKIILDISIWSKFIKKLESLITTYKDVIDLELIGFPDDYLMKLKK